MAKTDLEFVNRFADDLADTAPLSVSELPQDFIGNEMDYQAWRRQQEQRRRLHEQLMGPQEPTAQAPRLSDIVAHHEQSETVFDPTTSRWINVYGGEAGSPNAEGPARGLRIPLEPGVSYPTSQAGDRAAEIRSRMSVEDAPMRLKDLLRR